VILPLQSPDYWDYRQEPPHLSQCQTFSAKHGASGRQDVPMSRPAITIAVGS
jgi:hypothetical protein